MCMHPLSQMQVPKPLAPQELEQLKQEIAAELHSQMAADTGSKHLSEEQLAQVGGCAVRQQPSESQVVLALHARPSCSTVGHHTCHQ